MSNETTGEGGGTDPGSESSTKWADAIGDGGLVVVSNRQPYSHGYDGEDIAVEPQAGGLTAGLDPVMQAVGGTWVAWGDGDADRQVVDDRDCVAVPPEDPGYTLRRVWLSEDEVSEYYYGFSNQVLWPICHSALTNVDDQASYWDHYRAVNERFVDAVEEHASDGALVWFQDYHFALAPAMARGRVADDTVLLQFWHIPWPAWDTFRGCPHATALLEGLLGNDLLAFHVARYRENFLECVEAALDGATVDHETGAVAYAGHVTQVSAFPMGVRAAAIERRAGSDEAAAYWSSFRDEHDLADTVALGVDRLDYTKGIPERLKALEQLWADNPEWRGELTYVQNGSESRSQIDAYREIQERIAAGVDHLNDRFGTDDWTPVVYFRDYISQAELAGLYRNSDLALISPIRDGMNLVALEYVAAQVDGDGVLVLSDQAGAHTLLDTAVTATPQDIGAFTAAIEQALSMSTAERHARMRLLRERVTEHDLERWTELNIAAAVALSDGDEMDRKAVFPSGGQS